MFDAPITLRDASLRRRVLSPKKIILQKPWNPLLFRKLELAKRIPTTLIIDDPSCELQMVRRCYRIIRLPMRHSVSDCHRALLFKVSEDTTYINSNIPRLNFWIYYNRRFEKLQVHEQTRKIQNETCNHACKNNLF